MAAGHKLIGVAANDQSLLDSLAALIAPPPPDAPAAPRSLSLVGPGPDPDGGLARSHYALWEASQEVVRCRTPHRLIRSAVGWLDKWADARPPDLVGVEWLAAIDQQGRAILLPAHCRSWLHPLGARLRPFGLRPVDTPLIDLDPTSGELVVGRSAVAPGGDLPDAEEAVPSGRYSVAHLMVPVASEDDLRPGAAVALMAPFVVPGPPVATILGALEHLVRGARLHRLGPGTADEILVDLGQSLTL